MLEATAVTAGYRRGDAVLDAVDFTVAPGEVVGLAGASGSGKTTLVRVLAGLVTPRSGVVTLDGRALARGPRGAIGVVFQSPRTAADPRFTLARIIGEPARIRGERNPDVTALAGAVGLTPDLLERRPHEVSDGQLQRACVARALAQRPRYLLCDEATAMLDAATTAAVVRLLMDRAAADGIGVLVVSHDGELLDACCTRVATIESGSLRR
ncbi:ABC transporter ATP-binding protein [Nocardia sp. CC227C]|uniref:ABC transporter ATP-binding protein n=1 Tax=Nocardia sp. CC227C TaxID=3044562 RepID=UPI00278C8B62|nr:ATP-binding cassette domain-containing protein [Nocardia sp. CC227C]